MYLKVLTAVKMSNKPAWHPWELFFRKIEPICFFKYKIYTLFQKLTKISCFDVQSVNSVRNVRRGRCGYNLSSGWSTHIMWFIYGLTSIYGIAHSRRMGLVLKLVMMGSSLGGRQSSWTPFTRCLSVLPPTRAPDPLLSVNLKLRLCSSFVHWMCVSRFSACSPTKGHLNCMELKSLFSWVALWEEN